MAILIASLLGISLLLTAFMVSWWMARRDDDPRSRQ